MADNLYVGRWVSLKKQNTGGPVKWTARKIASVVDVNHVTLVGESGSKARGRSLGQWRLH